MGNDPRDFRLDASAAALLEERSAVRFRIECSH
jgi:hypothetical protein